MERDKTKKRRTTCGRDRWSDVEGVENEDPDDAWKKAAKRPASASAVGST